MVFRFTRRLFLALLMSGASTVTDGPVPTILPRTRRSLVVVVVVVVEMDVVTALEMVVAPVDASTSTSVVVIGRVTPMALLIPTIILKLILV